MRKCPVVAAIPLAAILTVACIPQNEPGTDRQSGDSIESAGPAVRHCFRNIYAGNDQTDIAELWLTVDDAAVSGAYNWIPALKDKRLGTFNGMLVGGKASVTYRYIQEGQQDTVALNIALGEKQAIVRGGPPALGLDLVLARVPCEVQNDD